MVYVRVERVSLYDGLMWLDTSAQQDRQIERAERAEDRKRRAGCRCEGMLCVFVGHGPAPFQVGSAGCPAGRGCKRTRRRRRTVRSVRKRRDMQGAPLREPWQRRSPACCLPEGIRLRRRCGQGVDHALSIEPAMKCVLGSCGMSAPPDG